MIPKMDLTALNEHGAGINIDSQLPGAESAGEIVQFLGTHLIPLAFSGGHRRFVREETPTRVASQSIAISSTFLEATLTIVF